ncbi:MAG: hypothetical protein M3P49_15500 [Actinomycetota bacterium]|nr:hypothetical protein [Actinomycetota bacterium]
MSRDQAATAFLEWLAAHKYTPVDLLQTSLLDGARQVYLPYYSFRVGYSADFSVSVGYHSVEEYTAYETVYENGRSRQVPRTKTRLRTDWRPWKDSIAGNFVEVVPDQTLRGGDFSAFLRGTTFRTEELVSPSSIDDDGQEVLAFARTPQESYARFVEGTMSERVASKIKRSLPGDTHRDLRYEWRDRYDSSRVYLPFWHFEWDYRGATYGAVVDGRRNARVDGRLPIDDELRRSANGTLTPLWIALGVGLVVCVVAASVDALSGFQSWFYAVAAVAVSVVGVAAYRRRRLVLGDAAERRREAVARVLSSELEGSRSRERLRVGEEERGPRESEQRPDGERAAEEREWWRNMTAEQIAEEIARGRVVEDREGPPDEHSKLHETLKEMQRLRDAGSRQAGQEERDGDAPTPQQEADAMIWGHGIVRPKTESEVNRLQERRRESEEEQGQKKERRRRREEYETRRVPTDGGGWVEMTLHKSEWARIDARDDGPEPGTATRPAS